MHTNSTLPSLSLRQHFLPLVISFLLAACGGGSPAVTPKIASATIGGEVKGVGLGVTALIVNNGSEIISASTDGQFAFANKVSAGGSYNVTLYVKPTGADCEIKNGVGVVSASGSDISNVSVVCQPGPVGFNYYDVGVAVSGLADGKSVTFANNGSEQLVATKNGLSIFSRRYDLESPPGGTYNVTVAANPTGQTCTLTNSSGINGKFPTRFDGFVNVKATCQ